MLRNRLIDVTQGLSEAGPADRNAKTARTAWKARNLVGILLPAIVCSSATAWPQSAQSSPPPAVAGQQSGGGLEEATRLAAGKQYPAAEASVRAYLRDNGESKDGHFLLGLIFFRENNARESLAEYTEGARFGVPSAADLKVVGLDYVLLEDYADAAKWLAQSVARDSTDAEAWYSLGRVEYTLNRFEDALRAFRKSLALDPRSVKAEDNLGLALAALNRSGEAIAAWRKAIQIQSDAEHPSEQPLLNLGTALVERNEALEAIALLQKAAAIAPSDPKIQEQLGRAYLLQNRLDLAAQHLEHAVALAPDDGRLHFQLGQVYRKLGWTEKAKLEFARTEALNGAKSNHP